MGLDVYLYKSKDPDFVKSYYDHHDHDEWHEQEEKICERIERDSQKFPEHMFKIGYFRSSYNQGGINRVLGNLEIPDLYSIFEAGEDYIVIPDWKKSLERVKQTIELFKKKTESGLGVVEIHGINKKKYTPSEALELTIQEIQKYKDDKSFVSWSSAAGTFFSSGLTIYAAFPGKDYVETILIVDNKENFKWYLQSLEIVQETIEFVLSDKESEKYYFHWSG